MILLPDGSTMRLCIGFATLFLVVVALLGIGYLIGMTVNWLVERCK